MPGPRNIVINTGPILALTAAGHLDLLRTLFGQVSVPAEVGHEIAAGGPGQFACAEFAAANWLDRRTVPTVIPPHLLATLDKGEAAVIALARFEAISTVCIDEVVGRRIARLHGLTVTGSLGILLKARQQGLPVKLRDSVGRMRQHGIWIGPALEAEVFRLAGE